MGNTQKEILDKYCQWLKIERGNSTTTIKGSLGNTERFLHWIKNHGSTLQTLNQETINDYLSYCYEKYSPNSMVVITINLRKFCECFLKKDFHVVLAHVRPPNRDKTALTQQEIQSMFAVVKGNPLETAILKVLYYTGMRVTELRLLELDDIDFVRLQIRIKHGKGDKMRLVNITKDAASSLKRYLQVRPRSQGKDSNALFVLSSGKRVSYYCLLQLVKRVAAQAGVSKPVYPHKMRISLITHCFEAGLSPQEVMIQSGHSDYRTLMGYIQHSNKRIRKAYEHVFKGLSPLSESSAPSSPTSFSSQPQEYKKLAVEKYLRGEITHQELHTLLQTLEEQEKPRQKSGDVAYQ